MKSKNKHSTQTHDSECATNKKSNIVFPFDDDDEFRHKFAAVCQDEIRLGTIVGFVFACFVLTVYIWTMYPSGISVQHVSTLLNLEVMTSKHSLQTVPGGDSGELIVAGCTVGIAHPPGNPRPIFFPSRRRAIRH